jgi:hypothetical protein
MHVSRSVLVAPFLVHIVTFDKSYNSAEVC